jgi:alkaline phosphatase
MKRRDFFRNGSVLAAVAGMGCSEKTLLLSPDNKSKTAKNIIFLVSDGMSQGTFSIAQTYLSRIEGKSTNWVNLYTENKVRRGLMDMASASSIVTDSAAASSSWGGGFRVPNGSLNIGAKGEEYQPILQKMKAAGKAVGCVTTVQITHATPAGFCVSSKSRNSQPEIAEKYLPLRFDIMMGGGEEFFSAEEREDKKDLFSEYKKAGYEVVRNRAEMKSLDSNGPVLGVFSQVGLPYTIDRVNDEKLQATIPTLAEMTETAINHMKSNPKGFMLQVEAGKVDWAAHGNDIAAILHDQLDFDKAVKVAMDFAEKDKNTLVVITTDHGNANPGMAYMQSASAKFDTITKYKCSNESILNSFNGQTTEKELISTIEAKQGYVLTPAEAQSLLLNYKGLSQEGVYNPRQLPFHPLAVMQKNHNAIGWMSGDHTGDFVELCMFGPGSESMPGFMKNTDMHTFLLNAADVKV